MDADSDELFCFILFYFILFCFVLFWFDVTWTLKCQNLINFDELLVLNEQLRSRFKFSDCVQTSHMIFAEMHII
jgi:hypothetical protein